jgi:ATP-dependent DNA helicase DinG
MESHRFTTDSSLQLRQAIADADGKEVLAVGRLDENRLVCEITVAARGSADAVPALMPYIERSDVVVHNHPSGDLHPSDADLRVASQVGNQGVGFYIVDNEVETTYVVAEAAEGGRITPIDAASLVSHLLPGGSLNRISEHFEARDSQIEMLEAIVQGFNDNGIVVVEAGTGVGKSLAYLIPAFQWAEQNKERIVISTATINLQQQLIENDIPLVRKMMGSKVKAVLVKGRRNYLCLKRLEEALEEHVLFGDEDDELDAIREWSESTSTGGKDDLSFLPSDSGWGRVCSEADTCLGLRCSRRNDCFVLRSRKEAASAEILVVNHHLLFSDLAIRDSGAGYDITAVLPPFQKVVFDEAHNMEKSATSFFSQSLSRFSANRALNVLVRERRGKKRGLLTRLRLVSSQLEVLEALPASILTTRATVDELDNVGRGMEGENTSRLVRERVSPFFETALAAIGAFQATLTPIMNGLHKIVDEFRDEEEPEMIVTAKATLRRFEDLALFCQSFLEHDEHPERVFWIEKRKTSSGEIYTVFHSTPVDVSQIMRDTVFAHYDTVVCTSATLTVRNDFSYWYRRIGLEIEGEKEVESYSLQSPFPYSQRVLLAAPSDGPEPAESGYVDYVVDFIRDALEISEGSALILFTSYQMLREAYDRLHEDLSRFGITALRQGTDDRLRLLRSFTQDKASVLFATDSFWEGVDTPGEALRVVIICRLPFQVPNDPVIQARHERILERNGNPFMELSLPDAVTRFKQGFGRLMRRATDRGVVLVLDSRILKKRYGSAFLESLPETQRCLMGKADILRDIERILYE